MNKKIISLVFIIMAGETVFMLPFLVPRLFRPLMLEAWNVTNTDIGLAFSAYGVSALISYFVGGPLADKYSPRKLIAFSLVLTALGGFTLILFPSKLTLIITYAYFGVSTILLMWGALIKVTHEVGGEDSRASAMGMLDSGRGLIAAIMSSVLVLFVTDVATGSLEDKIQSVNLIYGFTIFFTLLISVAIWFALKNFEAGESEKRDWDFGKAKQALGNLNVWLLGLIVLSAYCGYKNIDNYSIYLVDVQGVDLAKASLLTSVLFWVRPFAAIIAGVLADRVKIKLRGGRFLTLFTLMFLGAASQFMLTLNISPSFNFMFSTIIFSAAFVYALRSIYFAVFGELNIPDNIVGTTVGIVSVVGFLPDMFFGSVTGYLIDSYPGVQGFNYVFYLTSGFLFAGSMACFLLYKKNLAEQG